MFKHKHKIPTDLGDKDHILYLKTKLSNDERFYSLGKIEDGFFTITSNKPIDNFPSLDTLEFLSALKHDEYEDELNKIEVCKENIYIDYYDDVIYVNKIYYRWKFHNKSYDDFIFTIAESLDPNIVVINPIYENFIYYVFKENIHQPQVNIKFKIKRKHPYNQQDINQVFNKCNLDVKCLLNYYILFCNNVKKYKQLRKFYQNKYTYKNINIDQLIKILQYYHFICNTYPIFKDINAVHDKTICFFNFLNELKN